MVEYIQDNWFGVLVGLLIVAMTISEVLCWRKSFRRYREKRNSETKSGAAQKKSLSAMLEVARPISFFISVLSYVDVALLTLFAQDMLADTPLAENTLLLALPLTVVYLAYLVSGPVRMTCVRALGLRGALILGCAGMGAGFLLTAGFIALGNFALFVLAVFASKCFLYLTISCGRLMPTLAPSEHARTDINIETDNADVSASALMGVLAGYAAQYLGNASVYFVGLAFVVVLFVLVCMFVPAGAGCARGGEGCVPAGEEEAPAGVERENAQLREKPSAPLTRFIFHPSMVALFFFALITLGFSACYRSYLFPLFADAQGLNKAEISNLIVICSVIVFYAAPPLTRLAHRMGSRNLLTCVLIVCAVAFLGFMVVPAFLWAVVALLLVILIKKVGEPCARTLWPRVADAQGVSRHSAQAAYEVLDGIICFAKMPVTGALLVLGHVCVCAIFGIYSALSAALFFATTAKGPLRGREGVLDDER